MAVASRSRAPHRAQDVNDAATRRRPLAAGQQPGWKPLAQVRKELQVQWYRCPVGGGKLKKFMTPNDFDGAVQTCGHLIIFITTGLFTYYYWWHQMAIRCLAALFVHGTVGSCFLFGTHELGHGTVFKTKTLNQVFLYIFSLLSWWDPFDYALSHTHHHRYTQYPDADRENLFPLDPCLDPFIIFQMFTLNITTTPGRIFGKGGLISTVHLFARAALGLTPGSPQVVQHEWIQALHVDQPIEAKKSMRWSQFMLAFHASLMAYSAATGQWILPFILSFHGFTANWLRYFMGMTQHCGLKDNVPDFRKSVRSITLDPISEFLYWRMNWHTEHHMFAGVPCYNLKALHYEVAHDMPQPRTLLGAWREMIETYKRQQEDPEYQFDTPLPSTAGHGGKDSLVKGGRLWSTEKGENPVINSASIGNLAPDGLRSIDT